MPEITPIKLSELNLQIRQAIDQAFHRVSFWVIAEVTGHTFKADKNHHYFELVEKDPRSNSIVARIGGRAWSSGAANILKFEQITGQPFTNHIQVLVLVSVQFHEAFGLQVTVHDIDPNFTLGALEQQKQATLARLVQENNFIEKVGERYVTRNGQLKMNAVIQRIAVIASNTSAGLEDFKHTLAYNGFGYRFFVDDYFAAVQGEGNAEQFRQVLIRIFQTGKAYDAVVIIRGGGAPTDFLIFEDYFVGQAIAKFPIPIITGIGHQRNETIADLMAHTALKTPTQVAEFIIAHNRRWEEAILLLEKQIVIRTQQLFSRHTQALTHLNNTIVHQTRELLFRQKSFLVQLSSDLVSAPRLIVANRFNELRSTVHQLKVAKNNYVKKQDGSLQHFVSVMKIMAPDNILQKGFAIVKVKNKVTGNPDAISIGEDIDVILKDTELNVTVKHKRKYDGKDFKL